MRFCSIIKLLSLMVSLALFGVLCAVPAAAEPVFEVLFNQNLAEKAGVIADGGKLSADGLGWTSTSVGDMLPSADSITMDLPDTLPPKGYIEFDITRLKDQEGYDTRQSPYETIFELLNSTGDQLLVIHLSWEKSFGGKKLTSLHLAGNMYDKVLGSGPFGNVVVFDRRVGPDETVKFKLSYGPTPAHNRIFLDNEEASQYLVYKSSWIAAARDGDFGRIVQNASTMRIGIEKAHEDLFHSPLHFSSLSSIVFFANPTISNLNHNAFNVAGYSGHLVAGDTYTVVMEAEPGGTATFDLGPFKGHPMEEDPENPGTYRGTHIVQYGEDVEEGKVVGRFTSRDGVPFEPLENQRTVTVDTIVYMDIKSSNDLVPADRASRSGFTIMATNANGKAVQGHELKLTLSTTDEYTGIVGGISFEELIGGAIDVDWGGITDSFGEVTAQYVSGFAAKTILVSAKDMVTGDIGVGFVRSFIEGTVDVLVAEPVARALSVEGSLQVSLSRDWLTADGQSRTRITAVVEDANGKAISGHNLRFTLLGENGTIRIIQGKTDSRGRAIADYIAGTIMGQVQVEVRDLTSGITTLVSIELRPDAPAEIVLVADPAEVVTGGQSTVSAKVTDANGNPNSNVDVLYDMSAGTGALEFDNIPTNEDGVASVQFTAANEPGLVTVRGTVISREPTPEEISAAEGAIFLFGLEEDPGRLEVVEWLVEVGDEAIQRQELVKLEDRSGTVYTVVAPRDGIVSTFVAEKGDRVEYGDTLGYVIELPE